MTTSPDFALDDRLADEYVATWNRYEKSTKALKRVAIGSASASVAVIALAFVSAPAAVALGVVTVASAGIAVVRPVRFANQLSAIRAQTGALRLVAAFQRRAASAE